MKAIKYTSILNSVVSQEGAYGAFTNYIYYSVLVKYFDGTSDIVEGKSGDIAPLLPFLRTPQDEIEALRNDVKELKASIQHSDTDIGEIIDQKMAYVIDSLYPIPNVIGMKENAGISQICNAGLLPLITNIENRSLIDNRVISKCVRNSRNFKVVELTMDYVIPDVVGLPVLDAVEKLQHAGFVPTVKHVIRTNVEDGIVLSSTRKNEQDFDIDLQVSKKIAISTSGNTKKEPKIGDTKAEDKERIIPIKQAGDNSPSRNNGSMVVKTDDDIFDDIISEELSSLFEETIDNNRNDDSGSPVEETAEDTAREIIEGLRYATNLFSVISVRMRLEQLYSKTQSDIVKYVLEQPNETIKDVGKEVLSQLENEYGIGISAGEKAQDKQASEKSTNTKIADKPLKSIGTVEYGVNQDGEKAVYPIDNGYTDTCPICFSKQVPGRKKCFNCGTPFMY